MSRPEKVYSKGRSNPRIDIYAHLPYFREIARGNILEIGVHRGFSTAAFLLGVEKNDGHLYSVDIDPKCARLFPKHPQWTFFCNDSQNVSAVTAALRQEFPGSFDILFIDGSHEEAHVRNDLANYSRMVQSGGLILMHDIEEPEDKHDMARLHGWRPGELVGPRRAFDEFVKRTNWKHEIRRESWGLGVIFVP